MKSTLLVVLLSILLITVTVAYGQPTRYSQYSSDDLDMGIKYPNNWVYQEFTANALKDIFSTNDYMTIFVPPSEVSFQSNLTVSPPEVYVLIGKQRDLPYKNMPLDLYLNYSKKLKISQGFNITNTTKTNLTDGTPAYEFDASNDNVRSKMTVALMNKNPESYFFLYNATPEKFSAYLPIAKQMLKTLSFQNNSFLK